LQSRLSFFFSFSRQTGLCTNSARVLFRGRALWIYARAGASLFSERWIKPQSQNTEESQMTETRKYRIWLNGRPVEVAREVYVAYYNMDRRERYLEERDLAHGKTLYSQLDDECVTGEDLLPDRDAVSVEEVVERLMMAEKLRQSIALLRKTERELIEALFFLNGGDGMTEREYASQLGITQKGINKRKTKILAKLKKIIET
jgi:RNA polymerase sigma factor (sigma-70 family)